MMGYIFMIIDLEGGGTSLPSSNSNQSHLIVWQVSTGR